MASEWGANLLQQSSQMEFNCLLRFGQHLERKIKRCQLKSGSESWPAERNPELLATTLVARLLHVAFTVALAEVCAFAPRAASEIVITCGRGNKTK